MRKNNNKKGFTIVELVIVIAVIAILAAVLIPTFSGVIDKAKESAALQEAQALYKEIYAVDYSDGELDGKFNKNTAITQGNLATENITCKGKLTTYAPGATTGDKFKYTASNEKTVTLSIANNVETWAVN